MFVYPVVRDLASVGAGPARRNKVQSESDVRLCAVKTDWTLRISWLSR